MKKNIALAFFLVVLGLNLNLTIFSQALNYATQNLQTVNNIDLDFRYDFQFIFFDGAVGGLPLGKPAIFPKVQNKTGKFVFRFDFGTKPQMDRFAEIYFRKSTQTSYKILTARKLIVDSEVKFDLVTNAPKTVFAEWQNDLEEDKSGGTQAMCGPGKGMDNTFCGKDAGSNNTKGYWNAFFGDAAGFSNQNGLGNSFFGSVAGRANTRGSFNSFFGVFAGSGNKTGSHNAFFGKSAGSNNDTGGSNSFFGSNVGRENTKGTSNSFFGFQSGEENKGGNYNSFFGNEAGRQNIKGSYNSFFGRDAGYHSETGDHNSFFGNFAGGMNKSGGYNAFFGYRTGSSNLSGSSNSFLGKNAGSKNKFGSNNTIIGADADLGTDNFKYASAIGSGAIVTANNTIQLGRYDEDTVRVGKLGSGGLTQLCQNTSREIASCSSSIRYKSNVEDFHAGLDLIRKLRPVSFNWKGDGALDVGFVAEEVEKVEPLLTNANSNGEVEGVKYDRLGVVLVNATNEQQLQIDVQDRKIESHEKTIQKQTDTIKRQQKQIDRQRKELEDIKKLVCLQNSDSDICKRNN